MTVSCYYKLYRDINVAQQIAITFSKSAIIVSCLKKISSFSICVTCPISAP
jgi:hypothetical protein